MKYAVIVFRLESVEPSASMRARFLPLVELGASVTMGIRFRRTGGSVVVFFVGGNSVAEELGVVIRELVGVVDDLAGVLEDSAGGGDEGEEAEGFRERAMDVGRDTEKVPRAPSC